MHVPVLLNEVLGALDPQPGDFVIDGTVDGGGHASAILEKIAPKGKLLGTEWDAAMLAKCRARLKSFPAKSVILNQGNYADLPTILTEAKLPHADCLLLDLGFSSEQLSASEGSEKSFFVGESPELRAKQGVMTTECPEGLSRKSNAAAAEAQEIRQKSTLPGTLRGRGFSFGDAGRDDPLLMTYDDAREPLRDIISRIAEKELADIIFEFGGERRSRQIAKAIVDRRRKKAIETAGDLADIVRSALPKSYERGRIDPATRTFQALRIYANGELDNVTSVLGNLEKIVKPGGRVAVITFHSLEDRIVKNAFRDLAKQGAAELIFKKPVAASREEIRENPRSRSAKLRAIRLKMTNS